MRLSTKPGVSIKQLFAYLIIAALLFVLLPAAQAADPVSLSLGASVYASTVYSFPNLVVTGSDLKSITINFSQSVQVGDVINLPSTPSGFVVSATSSTNDYSKRINIAAGAAAADVQSYLRAVTYSVASGHDQKVSVSITQEVISYDTFYNIDTEHFYQYLPYTQAANSDWLSAYAQAKSMTYMGRTGYLATIVDQEEDQFLSDLSGGMVGWLGGTRLIPGVLTNLHYDSFNPSSAYDYWYWANGPEIGQIFYAPGRVELSSADPNYYQTMDAQNAALGRYANWALHYGSEAEPTNGGSTFASNPTAETALSLLDISSYNYYGRNGDTTYSWNDLPHTAMYGGGGAWQPLGLFVEFGDFARGSTAVTSEVFATAESSLSQRTVTVNTLIDGALADFGSLSLKRGTDAPVPMAKLSAGVYQTGLTGTGTYAIYANEVDTGQTLDYIGQDVTAQIVYYTVSFAAIAGGTATAASVAATANGIPIASGAIVKQGTTIILTASGSGAADYSYAWAGQGTSGQTTASVTLVNLAQTVDATCTVSGAAEGGATPTPTEATPTPTEATPTPTGATPTPTGATPTPTGATPTPTEATLPQTGDHTNRPLLLLLLGGSFVGLVILIVGISIKKKDVTPFGFHRHRSNH